MAQHNQIASTPGAYLDIPVKNYGVSAIGANLAVILDTSNVVSPTGTNDYPGVALPGSAGVSVLGITTVSIPAGGTGTVRIAGVQAIYCEGSITAGTIVQASATSSKVGWAKAQTSATAQIGMAVSSSTDGELILVAIQPAKNA